MAVEHFHTYLYGKKFKIYTDDLPNTLLVIKSNPHHRIERWMMRLQLYEFEMKYKPGNQNILADWVLSHWQLASCQFTTNSFHNLKN
jgi:hypothetical protein